MTTGSTVGTALAAPSAATQHETSEPAGKAKSGSSFTKFAAISASAFLHSATIAGLVGLVLAVPSAKAAVAGAFSSFVHGLGVAGAAVAAYSTAIAGGAVAAGGLNILDGFRAFKKGGQKIREYAEKMNQAGENANTSAFGKLKKLYALTRNRGVLQMLVGVAAVTIGAVVLAGVVSNPYALAAVGVVAAAVLVGAQFHKYIINRRISEQKRLLSPDDSQGTGAAEGAVAAANESAGPSTGAAAPDAAAPSAPPAHS